MDLDPTRQQKDFRSEVRNWLKGNIPKEPLPSMDTQEGFELHRAWEKKLFENVVSAPSSKLTIELKFLD